MNRIRLLHWVELPEEFHLSMVLAWLRHSWNADAPLNRGASHG